MSRRVQVVSGLIVREGRLLLTQRDPARSDFGWLCETPGGKVEEGEAPGDALARELLEELGVHAFIGTDLGHVDLDPPEVGKATRVTFYEVDIGHQQPRPLVAIGLVWVRPHALYVLDLAPGNTVFRTRTVAHLQDVETRAHQARAR